ncbi:MAG TPA: hypothetical protein VD837_13305 [Terriglobales bacterium]|nr:hypothetical protein [Terriglobales bacterium]
MTEFERKVLSELAELRTQMQALVGDGNAGRIKDLERTVNRHEAFVQRAGGLGAAIAAIVTMIHLGIDYLRIHH